MKRCTSCGVNRKVSDFPKDGRRLDGLALICKDCKDLRRRKANRRYQKTKKGKANQKKYRATPNGRKKRRAIVQKAYDKRRAELLSIFGHTHCMLCGRDLDLRPKRRKPTFARHHISYDPEVLVLLCPGCHLWLHGQSGVHNHVFKKRYEKDEAPYEFAKAVVKLYEEARE